MPEGPARVVHSPQPHAAQAHISHSDVADPNAPRAYDPAPPHAANEAVPVATEPLLSRRVPQANLAPELRRQGQGQAGRADGPLPDAGEARAALSRYQASRQAARAVVDESGAPAVRADEAGSGGPPAGGGWS